MQRYCLSCGTRRLPLPALIAWRIEALRNAQEAIPEDAEAGAPTAEAARELRAANGESDAEQTESEETAAHRFMPTPLAAATAILAMLAFGVILGSAIEPIAQSAGIAPILLEVGPSAAPSEPRQPAAAEPAAEPPPSPTLAKSSSAPPPASTSLEQPQPEAAPPMHSPPPELPETEVLPPITHVFLIVLGDHGAQEAFGEASPAPYLAKTLREKGELLPNYYAVTQGDLANEIALLSGQGPTAATAMDCPQYSDLSPASAGPEEQVEGEGCVYPATTQTLANQLAADGKSWKAYVEGMAGGETGASGGCRHPAPGLSDEAHSPLPGDPYLTWRNPVVYFHSLLDDGECAERDVGLEQLRPDLQVEAQTPALSYIVPNACHDGSEQPCEPGAASGLAAAQPFLETVVPEIEASAAYKKAGLIAITFAEAPHSGPGADPSSCCATPEYPNLPPAPPPSGASGPVKPIGGGGRVGMLLLSPFVAPGSSDEAGYYNHFSFLLSVEDLFGLQPLGYAANPALSAFGSTVFNETP